MNFNLKSKIGKMFGYDATETKGRRNEAPSTNRSEDGILTQGKRKALTGNAEDQQRNVAVCQWMINKHLDFVTKFTVQVKTGNDELDTRIEDLVKWWSRAKNCDVAERHSFQKMIRLLESLAVATGDAGIVKIRSGKIQGIEGTRVKTPTSGNAPNLAGKTVTQGIIHDAASKAISYLVNKRTKGGGMEYERTVSARNMEWHGYYFRFDQIRGISPLASALNTLRDLYESFEYSLVKAKFHSFFALAIMSEGDGGGDGFRQDEVNDKDTDGDGDADAADDPRYEFKLKPGTKLELLPGDTVDTIESKTPSNEFQDYSILMIQIALLSLNIPLTFFDSRKSSFSASRMDMSLYMESVRDKREALHDIIKNILFWKLGQWTKPARAGGKPLLDLPSGVTLQSIKLEIIATGQPWIDPLKEVNSDAKAIAIGVKSRTRACKERGTDFKTVLAELEQEEKDITKAGVTIELGTPGATTTRDEEGGDNPANKTDD